VAARADIRLRRAVAGEAELLGELCLRSKAVWGYDDAFLEACRAELRPMPEDIERGLVQVAEIGDEIAGVAEVSVEAETAYLDKLFVEPAFIGQDVGATLMRWAQSQAASLGARELVIESDPAAAGFYRRQGAQDAGLACSQSIPGRMLPRLVLPLPASSSARA
jgi:GNAT superfamily N-acetyltransferase